MDAHIEQTVRLVADADVIEEYITYPSYLVVLALAQMSIG
jgi:hypothetical protein